MSGKNKTKGVVMFAFGKRVYYWAAYNMAFSIKFYSPNIHVTLYVDSIANMKGCTANLEKYVDELKEIDPLDLVTPEGKFDPGRLKVSMYKYLPYDINLYLDVDGVVLKDIEPLFAELESLGKPYASHTVGYHTIDKGKDIPSMQWAWATDIWPHFKLDEKAILPAINSSLQYIEKSTKAHSIFKVAESTYKDNPLPVNKLRMKWGGGQPDELYMNVAFAITGYDPRCTNVGVKDGSEEGFIHFAMRRTLNYKEVTERYYIQSYYGGRNFTSVYYIDWLDRMLYNMHREKREEFNYKINRIVQQKHADTK